MIAEKIQQDRRCGFVWRVQTEPACNTGLQRQAKTVFWPTREEMQMTPHKPQETVRFDKRRLRERHGTSQCRRISPDSALQVSQATGALLEVRFVLEASYFVPCMPTSARQSVVNRVSPASCLRSR